MKRATKAILLTLLMSAVGYGLSGCIGYVGDGRGPEYVGHRDDGDYGRRYGDYYGRNRWYHDGPWMDGPRGYIGVEIHPERSHSDHHR